jgi:hypothetical protein
MPPPESVYRGLGNLWPARLHLNFDNAGGEAKNQWLFRFLGLLVLHEVFDCITVNTCLVGHTHNICDQLFSVWAKLLRITDAPTLSAMKNLFHERYSSKVAALIKLMRKEQLSDEEVHLLGLRGAHASIDIVGVAGAAVAAAAPECASDDDAELQEEESELEVARDVERKKAFLKIMEEMRVELHGALKQAGHEPPPVQPHIVHQAFSMNLKGWFASMGAVGEPIASDSGAKECKIHSMYKQYPMYGQQKPHVFAVERDRNGDVYLYNKFLATSTQWTHDGLQHHYQAQATGSYSERCLLYRASERLVTQVDPAPNPPLAVDTAEVRETVGEYARLGVIKDNNLGEWEELLWKFDERAALMKSGCAECARITTELDNIGVIKRATKSSTKDQQEEAKAKTKARKALRDQLAVHLATNAAQHAAAIPPYSAIEGQAPQDNSRWWTKWVERSLQAHSTFAAGARRAAAGAQYSAAIPPSPAVSLLQHKGWQRPVSEQRSCGAVLSRQAWPA